jgi:hypothetical protein
MTTCQRTWRLFALAVSLTVAVRTARTEPPRPPQNLALLIGCSAYPELSSGRQLLGPGNDVALTADLLRQHFGFAEAQIVTLVHDNDASRRPTYANIVREFKTLISRAGPGDNVFILLSGHGSQLRDDNPGDPNDDEYDGLDEVFLPEDVAKWKLDAPDVKAIRDDQFRVWLDAIRSRGALVFFVADTCHAGTLNRGMGDGEDEDVDDGLFFRERTVSAQLISSPNAFDDLPARDPDATGDQPFEAIDVVAGQPGQIGGLISLFAVDAKNTEKEHAMPPENNIAGPHYGRLTFALDSVLAASKRPLTYRELAQQIRWRYDGWNWRDLGYMHGAPEELDREVLGRGSWRNRSAVTLSRKKYGGLTIDAGVLSGASIGSVYRIYPPVGADADETAVGCVRVTSTAPMSSQVEACEFGGIPLTPFDKLPAPGRCELVYTAYDSFKMSINVAPGLSMADDADITMEERLVRDLAASDDAIFRISGDDEAPDALILVESDGLYLRRLFDVAEPGDEDPEARFPQELYGPFPAEHGADSKLAWALRAMAKATNIRRVATSELEQRSESNGEAIAIELTLERLSSDDGAYKAVNLMLPLDAYAGDTLRVSVFNRGQTPVDVTVLHINSALQIRSLYPTSAQAKQEGFTNRIAPGPTPAVIPIAIAGSAVGPEDLVVIATSASPESAPLNFAFLEQVGQNIDRGAQAADSALNMPAGQVFAALAFGRGDLSGLMASDLAKFAVHRLSWTKRQRISDGQ